MVAAHRHQLRQLPQRFLERLHQLVPAQDVQLLEPEPQRQRQRLREAR